VDKELFWDMLVEKANAVNVGLTVYLLSKFMTNFLFLSILDFICGQGTVLGYACRESKCS